MISSDKNGPGACLRFIGHSLVNLIETELLRILSKELKELEDWGLISRREYPTIPPKTEYGLTDLGLTLRPVMEAMAAWGNKTQGIMAVASN